MESSIIQLDERQFDEQGYLKTDSETDDILARCSMDTKAYGDLFYPETFYAPSSKQHDMIYEVINDPAIEFVVIAAPRGIGKTTIMKVLACKYIHFMQAKLICYISKSEGHAIMQTEDIKSKLITSIFGRHFFPSIKAKSEDGLPDEFSKKSWSAGGNTLIVPRGSGQQIRGLNWRDFRPDLIVVDDLEDTQTLNNEQVRKDRYNWFYADVIKARQQITDERYKRQNFKLVYIDTVKHSDSLIEALLADTNFARIRLPICDENYKTLFPVHKPQVDLDRELTHHRKTRTMDLFAMEYLCQAISTEDATFKPDYFQYYREDDQSFIDGVKSGRIESVVIVDPAKTAKMHNAQSGIVVWGVDVEKNTLWMREARGEFLHPDELFTDALNTAARYDARVIAVETTGLDEFIKQPMTNEMLRKGRHFELVWLSARGGRGELSGIEGGKDGRIRSLLHYYRPGLIRHNEVGCGAYEQQLLGFPKSKRKDIMDAAAYIVQLLEKGDRYFRFVYKEENASAIEDEYSEIEYEKPIEYEMDMACDFNLE